MRNSESLHEQTLDPRRAGQVTRYHTWPRVREQSVGEHSWQVARVVLALWPDAPRHVLVHCLFHDVGEVVGDLPYPMKRNDPVLRQRMEHAEFCAHLGMCLPWQLPAPVELSAEEKAVFKLAEYIEFWEWALYEISLGNQNARLVMTRGQAEIERLLDEMPEDVREAADRYMKRRQRSHEKCTT